jgi:hypothetical protein
MDTTPPEPSPRVRAALDGLLDHLAGPTVVERTDVVRIGNEPGACYGYECAECQEVTGLAFGSRDAAADALAVHKRQEHPSRDQLLAEIAAEYDPWQRDGHTLTLHVASGVIFPRWVCPHEGQTFTDPDAAPPCRQMIPAEGLDPEDTGEEHWEISPTCVPGQWFDQPEGGTDTIDQGNLTFDVTSLPVHVAWRFDGDEFWTQAYEPEDQAGPPSTAAISPADMDMIDEITRTVGPCGKRAPQDSAAGWLSEDQYDAIACTCQLPDGHEGPHQCTHGEF